MNIQLGRGASYTVSKPTAYTVPSTRASSSASPPAGKS